MLLAQRISKDLCHVVRIPSIDGVLPHGQRRVVVSIVQIHSRGDGAIVVGQDHVGVGQGWGSREVGVCLAWAMTVGDSRIHLDLCRGHDGGPLAFCLTGKQCRHGAGEE